jgi:hypothetical protein
MCSCSNFWIFCRETVLRTGASVEYFFTPELKCKQQKRVDGGHPKVDS